MPEIFFREFSGPSVFRSLGWMSLTALLTSSTGCGSGAYEAKFDKRLAEVRNRSDEVRSYAQKLARLDKPTPFPHSNATIRLPAGMRTPQANSATSEPPLEFRSPFTRFEGMQNMDDDSQLPFYIYLSIDVDTEVPEGADDDDTAGSSPVGGWEQTRQMLIEQLSERFPDLPVDADAWQTLDAPTPGQFGQSDQKTVAWRCLSLTAPQRLLVLNPENKNEHQQLDAQLDVCVYEFPGVRAIVVMQVPEGIDSAFDLDQMRPIILGTIETQ